MTNDLVTIGCPVQNREDTLPLYLEHIRNLIYKKGNIQLAFLINNSTDATYDILKTFREEYINDYRDISVWDIPMLNGGFVDRNRRRGIKEYEYFANIRNIWLNMVSPESDWVFSVDSDILVTETTLAMLKRHDKDICSALILNNVTAYNHYNIQLIRGEQGHFTILTDMDYEFKEGVIPVDMTGACVLMKKEAIGNTKYRATSQGEDFGFCEDLSKKGVGIFCDTTLRPEHLKIKNR